MASTITLRLDEETHRRVARIAKQKRSTKSAVLRDAIQTWAAREDSSLTPYERVKDIIGSVRGGDPKLSENTGRRFAEMLRAQSKR